MSTPKVVFLTNIPAPYREKMHEALAENQQIEYGVIYCAQIEPNRQWKFKTGAYKRWYLKDKAKSEVHNDPNVWKHLRQINPDVVVATGFYPTTLYGFMWSMLNRKKFIPLTDGTVQSEQELSFAHRAVRKMVYRFSASFIGASKGSFDLYNSYKVPLDKVFRCHLCIDNAPFFNEPEEEKKFDLMFSGQFIERKMPFFFAEVARKVKERLGDCKALVLGSGPLKEEFLKKLDAYGIDYEYPGFIQPHELPSYYKKAKLFLFPTLQDPWGIVANEACASGLPVLTCSNAGVADDLIIDGVNGYVLPLDEDAWVVKICNLLTNQALYHKLSQNALESVKPFNPHAAAAGIIGAVNFSQTH